MQEIREISSLSFIEFKTAHVAEWSRLAQGSLGIPIAESDGSENVLLRMDKRYRYSVMLNPGDDEHLSSIGWTVRNEPALEALADRIERSGRSVHEASVGQCRARDASRVLWFSDPDGVKTELVYGRRWVDEPLMPAVPMDGILGLGHITLATPHLKEYLSLYTEIFRFRLSDYRSDVLYFLGCDARHHSLALASSPSQGVHHFFMEVASLDDVGRNYDRVRSEGYEIEAELGRHGNDHAVSFYVKSPSGFSVECGWGGLLVEDDEWVAHEFTRGDLWGHRRSPEDAARVAQGTGSK